jgi:hypothetical protein
MSGHCCQCKESLVAHRFLPPGPLTAILPLLPRLSLAKTLFASVFNDIGGCYSQAVCLTLRMSSISYKLSIPQRCVSRNRGEPRLEEEFFFHNHS